MKLSKGNRSNREIIEIHIDNTKCRKKSSPNQHVLLHKAYHLERFNEDQLMIKPRNSFQITRNIPKWFNPNENIAFRMLNQCESKDLDGQFMIDPKNRLGNL